LGIPDTMMGLTFVAAGVSVPDALSSLAVIKEGLGDMAVSNAVGSNVFDILVCLGLPWFIQTAMIQPGSHVNVTSRGIQNLYIHLLRIWSYRLYVHLSFPSRLDVFHRFFAVDGGIPGAGDTLERLEAGPAIRHGSDDLVLDIYRVRVALWAQRLRRDESSSMPQRVLMQDSPRSFPTFALLKRGTIVRN